MLFLLKPIDVLLVYIVWLTFLDLDLLLLKYVLSFWLLWLLRCFHLLLYVTYLL